MYPSLATVAGLPASALQSTLEGISVAPLLQEPARPWKQAVFSQCEPEQPRPACPSPGSPGVRTADARCDLNASTGYYKRCSGDVREAIQVLGYSVRSADWRYTEWFAFDGESSKANMGETIAKELYDHRGDQGDDFDGYEQVNVVGAAENAATVAKLSKAIRDGWRKQLPPGL